MTFVLVNHRTPRVTSACAACSRQLELGYLRDLATDSRYCGVECYLRQEVSGQLIGSGAHTGCIELPIAWPTPTTDAVPALFRIT
jgi:hypothetical protein